MVRKGNAPTRFSMEVLFNAIKEAITGRYGIERFLCDCCRALSSLGDPIPAAISSKTANDILHHKREFDPAFKLAMNQADAFGCLESWFKKDLIPLIPVLCLEDAKAKIADSIQNDPEISRANKKFLLDGWNTDPPASFLARVMIYAIQKKNVLAIKKNKAPPLRSLAQCTRPVLDIPSLKLKKTDLPYIKAMKNAIRSLPLNERPFYRLSDECEIHAFLDHQQRAYQAAIQLKKHLSEIISSNYSDPFGQLCEEIMEGIEGTYHQSYANGVIRMMAVLQQAALLPLSPVFAMQKEEIGQLRRKGICHILINNGTWTGW